MPIILIRAIILYFTVVLMIRLMGKRQIGELQPSELVVTILISEIASQPVQDPSVSVAGTIATLILLVSLEIITSALNLKSSKLRTAMQGHPVIVIRDGKIDVQALRKLRLSVNDLLTALRQKDVFELSQVSYAIFETNGKMSVLLKPQFRPSTAADLKLRPDDDGMPFAVICDGKIHRDALTESGMTQEKINAILKKHKTSVEEILIMTVNTAHKTEIVKKEKK